jgi:REP element-mobilizing transposase RayT
MGRIGLAFFAGMRHGRIKIPAAEGEACYHCVTRTVNKEFLFDDTAKEVLRRQVRQVADYCGVEVLTYTLMANHFHVLVRVPRQEPVSDEELLRRFSVLYPKPTAYQSARLDVVRAELASNGPNAQAWRRRQLALMGDISQFMKLLKQRFSIWYNKSHQRIGTLWAERFKSTLIEGPGLAVETMAAYLDLNSVRAGLVADPKDYHFCGYAEAVAGNEVARGGIVSVMGASGWEEAQRQYRQLLFATGAGPREGAASISGEELERVMAQGGRLPLATVLRCRVRYFTDGAVLGSRAFVEQQLASYRQKTGQLLRRGPQPLPAATEWGDFATLRALRRPGFG